MYEIKSTVIIKLVVILFKVIPFIVDHFHFKTLRYTHFKSHGTRKRTEARLVPLPEVDVGAAQEHVDDPVVPVLDGVVQHRLLVRVLPVDQGSVLW